MIEAPEKLTDAELRWCDESERLLAALAVAEPRIAASRDRDELRKLCDFFRRCAAESRSLTAPTARTEDIRRPLELACISFARSADERTRNFTTGAWTRTMAEGIAFYEQCAEFYSEFAP